MQKEDFKAAAQNEFNGKTLEIVNKQIDNFYELNNQIFKNTKYKVGDSVVLTPNTYC